MQEYFGAVLTTCVFFLLDIYRFHKIHGTMEDHAVGPGRHELTSGALNCAHDHHIGHVLMRTKLGHFLY
jgi:hypothetical protein